MLSEIHPESPKSSCNIQLIAWPAWICLGLQCRTSHDNLDKLEFSWSEGDSELYEPIRHFRSAALLLMWFFLLMFYSRTEEAGGLENHCSDNQRHEPGQTPAQVERCWPQPDQHKPRLTGSCQIWVHCQTQRYRKASDPSCKQLDLKVNESKGHCKIKRICNRREKKLSASALFGLPLYWGECSIKSVCLSQTHDIKRFWLHYSIIA